MTNRSETPTKREFFERVVQELNLDTTDPFTRLFANLLAIADRVDGLKAALTAAQALAEQQQAELQRAMSMLEAYGVPAERAKSVTNGIDVLMTRMSRAVHDAEALAEQYKRDAERYRYVRANPAMLLHLKNSEFDAAIDAALSAKSEGGGHGR